MVPYSKVITENVQNSSRMKKRLIIYVLTFVGFSYCVSSTFAEVELQQDTTCFYEKDYPNYNMCDFDTKELAELLVNEKRAGVANDSAFANFFCRCGMVYGDMPRDFSNYLEYKFHVRKGYFKIYSGNNAYIKATSVYEKSEDGKMHHTIGIEFPKEDTNRLQWMTVKLRAFGMKDERSEAVKLKGKGLRAFGMKGFFEIKY